jgi:hypothetical protein
MLCGVVHHGKGGGHRIGRFGVEGLPESGESSGAKIGEGKVSIEIRSGASPGVVSAFRKEGLIR